MSAYGYDEMVWSYGEDPGPPQCRCKHDTSNPELGCTCGYADWLCDEGLS